MPPAGLEKGSEGGVDRLSPVFADQGGVSEDWLADIASRISWTIGSRGANRSLDQSLSLASLEHAGDGPCTMTPCLNVVFPVTCEWPVLTEAV